MFLLKVAIIGFGGIAQAHRYAYWYYNKQGMPVRLVAACDTDPEKFKTMTKINIPLRGEIVNEEPFNTYTDWEEMIKTEKPDLVDICLPTKFHEPVAVKALSLGVNVMCEKPMAASYEECERMVEAAEKYGKTLMIAHCVRFQPEYVALADAVKSGRYGKVLAATFHRYSPIPMWNIKWRIAAGKAGSCLTELNIHDIDVVRSIFGEPSEVSCRMRSTVYPYDYADSLFVYDDCNINIKSAWYGENYIFSAGYEVVFTDGVLIYRNGTVEYVPNGKNSTRIEVEDIDGVMGEIKYIVDMLDKKESNSKNPPTESAKTVYALEKLYESADNGGKMVQYDN